MHLPSSQNVREEPLTSSEGTHDDGADHRDELLGNRLSTMEPTDVERLRLHRGIYKQEDEGEEGKKHGAAKGRRRLRRRRLLGAKKPRFCLLCSLGLRRRQDIGPTGRERCAVLGLAQSKGAARGGANRVTRWPPTYDLDWTALKMPGAAQRRRWYGARWKSGKVHGNMYWKREGRSES
uniref:Uncharacterized protein n=1 Tax=Steinernema glaseri TaxID=37863 RepID=A0A1I7YKC1_9BILA